MNSSVRVRLDLSDFVDSYHKYRWMLIDFQRIRTVGNLLRVIQDQYEVKGKNVLIYLGDEPYVVLPNESSRIFRDEDTLVLRISNSKPINSVPAKIAMTNSSAKTAKPQPSESSSSSSESSDEEEKVLPKEIKNAIKTAVSSSDDDSSEIDDEPLRTKRNRKRKRKNKNKYSEDLSNVYSAPQTERVMSTTNGSHTTKVNGNNLKPPVHKSYILDRLSNSASIPLRNQGLSKLVSAPTLIIGKRKRFYSSDEDEKDNDNNLYPQDYSTFPQLESVPLVNDIIAFKTLELSADYTPQMSDYIKATVIQVHNSHLSLKISNNRSQKTTNGKFELPEEKGEEDLPPPEFSIINYDFSQLKDPVLISRLESV